MAKRIYVGNIPFSTTPEEVRELFAQYGTVTVVDLLRDRETGRLRGFGFVEMANDDEADEAISNLHQTSLGGRSLNINEARPREPRSQSGGW